MKKNANKISIFYLLLLPLLCAWSKPTHQMMADLALERLPAEERQILAPYRENFVNIYTIIPDLTKRNPSSEYSQYVESFISSYEFKDMLPAKRELLLHAADKSENNFKTYSYYTKTILEKFKQGEAKEAIIYLGTFLHLLQDTSCPAHPRYGPYDHPRGETEGSHLASLHFFKRFMPVPEKYQDVSLHSFFDNCGFTKEQLRGRLSNYTPILLGNTVDEVLSTLKSRHEKMMLETDSKLIPMLQARFAEKEEEFVLHGLDAAELSQKLTADYIHTILWMSKHIK